MTILKTGMELNMQMIKLAGRPDSIRAFKVEKEEENQKGKIPCQESGEPAYMSYEDGTITFSTKADKVYMNPDAAAMFDDLEQLTDISGCSELDTSKTEDLNNMFCGCIHLSDISPVKNWETGKVKDMSALFWNCWSLKDLLPVAGWDVSGLCDAREMFASTGIADLNALADWDTSSLVDAGSMFESCYKLKDISALARWDIRDLLYTQAMFEDCGRIGSILPLADWDVGNIFNNRGMFDKTVFQGMEEYGKETFRKTVKERAGALRRMDCGS